LALSLPHEKAKAKRKLLCSRLSRRGWRKFEGTGTGKSDLEIETAIKQIVDEGIEFEQGHRHLRSGPGMAKPEISISVRPVPFRSQRNDAQDLALELLKKILNDEIKSPGKDQI